jgi:hypothetical protein
MSLPYTQDQRSEAGALLDQIRTARTGERDNLHTRRLAKLRLQLVTANYDSEVASTEARDMQNRAVEVEQRINNPVEPIGRQPRRQIVRRRLQAADIPVPI